MLNKKLNTILFIITAFAFLSLKQKEMHYDDNAFLNSNYTHKEFYDTGELRYICHDRETGTKGKGTGVHRLFKFKTLFYDKCGTIKLIVKGKGETGCWINKIEILHQKKENESLVCEKEVFIYPSEDALEKELKLSK